MTSSIQPGLTFAERSQSNPFAFSPQAMRGTFAAAKRADAATINIRDRYRMEAEDIFNVLLKGRADLRKGGLFPALACALGRMDLAERGLIEVANDNEVPSMAVGWGGNNSAMTHDINTLGRKKTVFAAELGVSMVLLQRYDIARLLLKASESQTPHTTHYALATVGALYYMLGDIEPARRIYESLNMLRIEQPRGEGIVFKLDEVGFMQAKLAFGILGCLMGERDYAVVLAASIREEWREANGLLHPLSNQPSERSAINESFALMLALLGGAKI